MNHVPRAVTLHHYGGTVEYPNILRLDDFSIQELRRMQKDDIELHGFKDIRHHAIIAPSGEIFLGRPFDVLGSHLRHKNQGNIGILVYGNFNIEHPTSHQIKSLCALLRFLELKFPTIELPKSLHGHLDFAQTLCPGNNLYAIINDIKFGIKSIYEEVNSHGV
jgi:hypothetical protein